MILESSSIICLWVSFLFFWASLVVPMYTSCVLRGALRFVLIKVLLLIKKKKKYYLKMYQIRKEGIAFQTKLISFWPTLLFQLAKRSTTHLGITHSTPNN
jgi:hypothetical protein